MKSFFLVLLIITSIFSVTAQQKVTKENTLENQFDNIYRISTSYQTYKVINKIGYQKLKNNVLDSINSIREFLSLKESLLKSKDNNIKRLNKNIKKTQLNLEASIKKENSILLFGLELKKTTYNIILWTLIIALIIGVGFLAYKFSKSNILTKEAENNLADIEEELKHYRKKSTEKEQKLRRQLQDEINKQRNS
jgi:septal ring factor EnvC (AmiA/AmiB activator)